MNARRCPGWIPLSFLLGLGMAVSASGQAVDEPRWRETGDPLVPRVRVTELITDDRPAVLEAVVESPDFTYTVDWNDGGEPETGRGEGGRLYLTHDFDLISSFNVRLSVASRSASASLPPLLVVVTDDDDVVPRLEWRLPPPVVRPGEPALVGWEITDASGLAFVSVVVQGPAGPLARFDTARGEYDLTGRPPGSYGIEVQTRDRDDDRPGDALGYMVIETITITDDVDRDGVLDYLDNCPRVRNPDQRDRDGDGLGDACDPCPDENARCTDSPPVSRGGGEPLPGEEGQLPAEPALAALPLPIAPGRRRRGGGARRRRVLRVSAALVAGVLLPALAAAAPSISAIRPQAILAGEPVVILGSGFGTAQGPLGRVTFGGVDAGTVYHWTDTRIVVEVPLGSLVAGVPTPTPTGPQPVEVRTAAGEVSVPVDVDIKLLYNLAAFHPACRCGDPGCDAPCLPDDYCRPGAGGCIFDGEPYDRRDIKDVDFGDLDDDGDLDILDVSSPMQAGDPTSPGAQAGFSPAGCGDPVNFPDRLFVNDGSGRFADITGGADGDYDTPADNPLPLFHSFRTYDADLVDVNGDGHLDLFRADRALCGGDPAHVFRNVDTSGDGEPDNSFQAFAVAVPTQDAYWDNLSTGDVDGDGDLDLLISHSGSTTAPHALQLNDGTGAFTLYDPVVMAPTHAAADDFTAYTTNAHDMALVDLDDDRDLDLVIGGGNHGTSLPNFILLNRLTETGELFFESVPIPRAAESSATVHVGTPDLNGDGRRDVHFVNDYYSIGPADRLFLNLGPVTCGSATEAACPDGLTCSGAGQVINDRICWLDASTDLPEEVAGAPKDGYGADYGDLDADGDLDILVTGLDSGGNYLFLNRAHSSCASDADCPADFHCDPRGCLPDSDRIPPKWWSCPPIVGGTGTVLCNDRHGDPITGPDFPAAQVTRRSLAVFFGDVDGDVDLEILWARGQWDDWTEWPNAGPLLLVADNVPPTVEAGPDQIAIEDQAVALGGAGYTDPGLADTHTATIDWGDGSPLDPGTVTPASGSGTVDGSHVYDAPGAYTVTVTVSDDHGGVGSDTKTIRVAHGLLAYCFFGQGDRPILDRIDIRKRVLAECRIGSHSRIRLKRRVEVTGDLVSYLAKVRVGKDDAVTGDVTAPGGPVKVKRRSTVVGDVTAGEDAWLRRRVRVDGDATAGGTVRLKPTATVTGTITDGAAVAPLPPVTTVTLALAAGGPDVLLTRNEVRSVAPGSYGRLRTAPGAVVQLTAGTYRFERFNLGRDAKLELDLAGGPIVVEIEDLLKLKRRTRMLIVSATGDAEDVLFLVDSARRLKLKKGGHFLGTFLAPDGDLKLGKWAELTGALYGRQANAKKGAEIVAAPAVDLFVSVFVP